MKEKLYGVAVIGTVLRLLDRYKDDACEQHAAAIGLFGFLSIFPLLLLVIAGAATFLPEDLKVSVIDAVFEAIPGLDGAFEDQASLVQTLSDNAGAVGGIGALSLLFTGLKVINSANVATMHIMHIRVDAKGFLLRVRQLGVLAALGILAIVGVVAAGLVGSAASLAQSIVENATDALPGGANAEGLIQLAFTIGGYAISVGADFLLFLMSYKLLSFGFGASWRQLWPGALLGGIGWTVLKGFGASYVAKQVAGAPVAALAGAVGILAILYLAGRVYLYGLELNCIVRRPGADLAGRSDQVTYDGENLDIIRLRPNDPELRVPTDLTGDGEADDVLVLPAGQILYRGTPTDPVTQRAAALPGTQAYAFSGGRAGGSASAVAVEPLQLGRPRSEPAPVSGGLLLQQAASVALLAAAWGLLFRFLGAGATRDA